MTTACFLGFIIPCASGRGTPWNMTRKNGFSLDGLTGNFRNGVISACLKWPLWK